MATPELVKRYKDDLDKVELNDYLKAIKFFKDECEDEDEIKERIYQLKSDQNTIVL